ncbi:hypothetical protein OsJ_11201 [Oryza sativa Japonica Group]|uniref:Uncharacterized protein n=2 Tax=Oryza sativa subsp. japonica TaxID=39947 RepID=A0A9K3Y6P5_ORYSJ|nr:hypothetical protein [Oryza sativa Japonica Group]ABF96494.1 hypothetical protein LOC_Os03g29065 [Oryza sativa Japonica Group]EAZ27264.1 hypothetical protein OsJ_11201 [Oryza sativa Japonica Group]
MAGKGEIEGEGGMFTELVQRREGDGKAAGGKEQRRQAPREGDVVELQQPLANAEGNGPPVGFWWLGAAIGAQQGAATLWEAVVRREVIGSRAKWRPEAAKTVVTLGLRWGRWFR